MLNEADGVHDLEIAGVRTRLLDPGESQRIVVASVDHDVEAWCTIGDHRLGGMELEIRIAPSANPSTEG